jgi:sugar O-acyltransferase (sialic acid O-acetyltransferase NeuD family)
MAKVIIFGIKDLAQLAHFYLTTDSEHHVVAFSVHQNYIGEFSTFCNLPIYPFENIEKYLNPDDHSFLIPMTHSHMNKDREKVYNDVKLKGYDLISYISSKATVLTDKIGENCFILEDNTIQPFVTIGNNVVLWSGNHIGHHSVINDHVFITSQVVISGNCMIEQNSFLGVNCCLKERIKIGESSFIAMGCIITKNTEPFSVYNSVAAEKLNMSSLKIRF